MCLGVLESGDASLVDGIEVDKEHVQTTRPAVSLFGTGFDVYVWGGMLEEWGGYVEARVSLAQCVVDRDDRLGWAEV